MTQMDGWKPLAGLKVIDFSMLLPGPLTTLILRDLGAEVIKVEPPGGDYARHMNSHMFQGANRGKDSIALDLKTPEARPILEKLARYGDVVIEGFRPGVADRLGFGPDALQALNPKLVYCSLSGFGQTGPAATHAGHDLAYLAMGGALAHRGQLRQPPSRAALPIADIAGGAFAAIAILAALREVESGTPRGKRLDLSLYEATLYATAIRFGFETPASSVDHLYPANDLFTCADGRQIALTVIEEKFWDNLVRTASPFAPSLAEPRYQTEAGRLEHHADLMAALDALFLQRPAQDWIDLFAPADVPAAICLTPAEALETAQTKARGLCQTSPQGAYMPFPVLADAKPVAANNVVPELSAQAGSVLQRLGYSADEAQDLIRSGILSTPAEAAE
ncbi:MAG: CaiB/BaiF CoA-transferase family protein [Pseudomonadota bacterium]|nr:CaiB/BaiF CoA-transferase family protein [Pseudomonadota bacterium]